MRRAQLTGRGRRRLLTGHPWIYRDDVVAMDGEPGELVPLQAPDESPLGWGLVSTESRIAVRAVSFRKEQPNRAFWLARVKAAIDLRDRNGMLDPGGACRLCHGDADGLPGLVVDRYADHLVVASGCQGSDRMRDFLIELFLEALPFEVNGIYERSDSATRKHEALAERTGWLRGEGEGAREIVEVTDAPRGFGGTAMPMRYRVNLVTGHKTGHYLDQVENRAAAAAFAQGRAVLDAFSYDGLFGVRAALAGAEHVLALDQSAEAGERLRETAEANGVGERVAFERTNAMHALRDLAAEGRRFGLVVVDPPAFAKRKGEIEGAKRGYRELNRRAMELTEEGGVLVSASCSFNIDPKTFLGTLAQASLDAGRTAKVFALRGASVDHPGLATLPESTYLKVAFCRIDG